MSAAIDERDLRDVLERLETALNTPIVSGELESWSRNLQSAARSAKGPIEVQVDKIHSEQYGQIAAQDPELLPRVQTLTQEDRQILVELAAVTSEVGLLVERANRVEPDESAANREASQVIAHGVALINRVRKQEVAVETWFVEAFQRDRGSQD